ncbi:hypothetical protein IEO21_01611 [Rhodonia placenta]|uniref:Uncharacterized protein n=1 Tax=Rhodonia placenta TaxID=104341 RepID=A0A8H7P995_9APHY|nr:hypothetical protein IEO21_01611 [Postia placenta]
MMLHLESSQMDNDPVADQIPVVAEGTWMLQKSPVQAEPDETLPDSGITTIKEGGLTSGYATRRPDIASPTIVQDSKFGRLTPDARGSHATDKGKMREDVTAAIRDDDVQMHDASPRLAKVSREASPLSKVPSDASHSPVEQIVPADIRVLLVRAHLRIPSPGKPRASKTSSEKKKLSCHLVLATPLLKKRVTLCPAFTMLTLTVILWQIKQHRAHSSLLMGEYVNAEKAKLRAMHELQMAQFDLEAAMFRRQIADAQLDMARQGKLGIDYERDKTITLERKLNIITVWEELKFEVPEEKTPVVKPQGEQAEGEKTKAKAVSAKTPDGTPGEQGDAEPTDMAVGAPLVTVKDIPADSKSDNGIDPAIKLETEHEGQREEIPDLRLAGKPVSKIEEMEKMTVDQSGAGYAVSPETQETKEEIQTEFQP